jgi:hypothetical protein
MYRPYERDWQEWDREPESSVSSQHTPPPPDLRILVHPLVLCPPLVRGTRYLLVIRRHAGQRQVVASGRAQSPHPMLNLARVRHTAACLGATEVHVLP